MTAVAQPPGVRMQFSNQLKDEPANNSNLTKRYLSREGEREKEEGGVKKGMERFLKE